MGCNVFSERCNQQLSCSISFLSAILVRVVGGGRIPKKQPKVNFLRMVKSSTIHHTLSINCKNSLRFIHVRVQFHLTHFHIRCKNSSISSSPISILGSYSYSLISTLIARIVQFHINSFPQQLQKQLTFIFTFQQEGQITNKEVTNCNNNMLHITFGFLFCCNMLVLPTYKVSRHPHTLWLRLINVQ